MYLHYVMEYCDGGDLLAFVMERSFLYEEIAARIMYKLLSAVNHMHENDIWHRDIKMENILFSSKKKLLQGFRSQNYRFWTQQIFR